MSDKIEGPERYPFEAVEEPCLTGDAGPLPGAPGSVTIRCPLCDQRLLVAAEVKEVRFTRSPIGGPTYNSPVCETFVEFREVLFDHTCH